MSDRDVLFRINCSLVQYRIPQAFNWRIRRFPYGHACRYCSIVTRLCDTCQKTVASQDSLMLLHKTKKYYIMLL